MAKTIKITQAGLARIVGISTSHMSLILSRKRTPSLAVAKRLADALGVTIDYLFRHGISLEGYEGKVNE